MPRRKRWDVAPNKREGGWIVRSGNAREPFATKNEARRAAVGQARSQGDSQVVIHRRDGSIQEERTYNRDPRRTPG